jgi:hypothetical protein
MLNRFISHHQTLVSPKSHRTPARTLLNHLHLLQRKRHRAKYSVRPTRMSFLSLPLEILQYIVVYVATAHRPSLCALSLTSKAFYNASLSLLWQQISITVNDRE